MKKIFNALLFIKLFFQFAVGKFYIQRIEYKSQSTLVTQYLYQKFEPLWVINPKLATPVSFIFAYQFLKSISATDKKNTTYALVKFSKSLDGE